MAKKRKSLRRSRAMKKAWAARRVDRELKRVNRSLGQLLRAAR